MLRAMLRTRFQPGRELWRHRASDLPTHRAAGDDVTTVSVTDEHEWFPASDRCPGRARAVSGRALPRLLWAALATAVLVTIGVASAQSMSPPPRTSYTDLAPIPGAGRSSAGTGPSRAAAPHTAIWRC